MPDYSNMNAVEALRYAKEQSGKTAEEIAKAMFVSTAVATRYFKAGDDYGPNLGRIPALCGALGNTILIDWLRCQTAEPDAVLPAQDRTHVLTAVARASAALGEVSRILAETEQGGIDAGRAREIRSGLEDVKLACSAVQGMLADVAASRPGERKVLYSIAKQDRPGDHL